MAASQHKSKIFTPNNIQMSQQHITDYEILQIYYKMVEMFSFEVEIDRYNKFVCYKILQKDCKSTNYRGVIARSVDYMLEFNQKQHQAQLISLLQQVLNKINLFKEDIMIQTDLYFSQRLFNCPQLSCHITLQLLKDIYKDVDLQVYFDKFQEPKVKPLQKFKFIKEQTLGLLYVLHKQQEKEQKNNK